MKKPNVIRRLEKMQIIIDDKQVETEKEFKRKMSDFLTNELEYVIDKQWSVEDANDVFNGIKSKILKIVDDYITSKNKDDWETIIKDSDISNFFDNFSAKKFFEEFDLKKFHDEFKSKNINIQTQRWEAMIKESSRQDEFNKNTNLKKFYSVASIVGKGAMFIPHPLIMAAGFAVSMLADHGKTLASSSLSLLEGQAPVKDELADESNVHLPSIEEMWKEIKEKLIKSYQNFISDFQNIIQSKKLSAEQKIFVKKVTKLKRNVKKELKKLRKLKKETKEVHNTSNELNILPVSDL